VTELELHAAGFAVRHDGKLDPRIHARFRAFVRARGVIATAEQVACVLADATTRYRGEDALLVCDAAPCAGSPRLTACEGVPIRRTGCQGFCKHKPMVAVRIGDKRELIGRATTERDRDAVAAYVRAAFAAGSMLVPERGAIEPLRIDPDHGGAPAAQLRAVHFLSSRFRGAGRYADGSYSFTKELVGTYEAGGRVLALRMAAHYPTADHGLDVHRALVIVGIDDRGALSGRAYTDGGDIHDYAITLASDELQFADRSPDHGARWKAVRKRLVPTTDGYEERLEVDRGGGYEPFYAVAMQRA